jgi:very-short-patch-repair endonuclease
MNTRSNLKHLARRLRRDQTDTEQLMWSLLRAKRFDGFKFRRQHPIGDVILDFYCPRLKLNIELDGGQHFEAAHRAADVSRDQMLRTHGVTVLRFEDRTFFKNRDGVMHLIWETLQKLSAEKTPLLTSPRVRGEEPDFDSDDAGRDGGQR